MNFHEERCRKYAGWPGISPEGLQRLLEGNLPVDCPGSVAECVFCITVMPEDRVARSQVLACHCALLMAQIEGGEQEDYLNNLLEFGGELQESGILFQPALHLEHRVETGQVRLSDELKRKLRRLIICNQPDNSLESRWLAILKKRESSNEEVMDAFAGIVCIPSGDDLPPRIRIAETLPLLSVQLAERKNGEILLKVALRLVQNTYPCDRWKEWLLPFFASWDPFLQNCALAEVSGLKGQVDRRLPLR